MAKVVALPPKAIPFLVNAKGQAYSNLANIKIALEHDPALKEAVSYDEFLGRIQTGTPPREWSGADDTRLALYLQTQHRLVSVTVGQVRTVIDQHARCTPRNCVRDWLTALVWDGVPRIAEAFCDYWNATPSASQPHDYLRAISRNFFVAIVARALHPGCQVDEMVVFESSEQGLYKSSALQVLAGEWFAVAHERVTDKDFFQDLQGKLLIEISELSSFPKSSIERIKSVITTRVDRFRGSYDPRSTDHPRRNVFAGTTNSTEWLADDTGGRRFWPAVVGLVDVQALAQARDQLFAEAVVAFSNGESWWEVPPVAKQIQAARYAYDEWTSIVMPWAKTYLISQNKDAVTVGEILGGALRMTPDRATRADQMRVASILRVHGWTTKRLRVDGIPTRLWFPGEAV